MLGGVVLNNGTKLQGINEKINLYCQKNKLKLPRLEQLYKMILSDRETSSFVVDVIENDEELIAMLKETADKISLSNEISLSEYENIFIKYTEIGNLPGVSYTLISDLIIKTYDERCGTAKRKKSYESNRKRAIESQVYSICMLSDILKDTEIDLMQNIETKYNTGWLLSHFFTFILEFERVMCF